jgi:hypothetical protein
MVLGTISLTRTRHGHVDPELCATSIIGKIAFTPRTPNSTATNVLFRLEFDPHRVLLNSWSGVGLIRHSCVDRRAGIDLIPDFAQVPTAYTFVRFELLF